jgi:intracellular sulfur oxidation DsrE/DsrF family protein
MSRPRHPVVAALAFWLGLPAAGLMLAGPLAMTHAAAQPAEDDGGFVTHRLALQVSDDDEAAMRSALDVAANVSRFYSSQAEEVDIRIVVYGPGLTMLRPDKTPVLERLTAFEQSMPNVAFVACGNTLDTLEREEGTRPEIVPFAEVVEAGVAELIRLDEEGFTIVKP